MNLFANEYGSAMHSVLLGALVTVGLGAAVATMSGGGTGAGLDMSDPNGGQVQSRVYQGKAVAEMQAMAKATVGFFLSTGHYPDDLQELLDTPYGEGMSLDDPWGNPWAYRTEKGHFLLLSYGSDGKRGPEPPENWGAGTETDPDLIIRDGAWLQVPQRDNQLGLGAR